MVGKQVRVDSSVKPGDVGANSQEKVPGVPVRHPIPQLRLQF
jgi:hypothetical protein